MCRHNVMPCRAVPCHAAGLVAAVQAAHADLKAQQGAVLVTGGGLALEVDAMTAAAANWGIATLGIAKAAQRKLVHILHTALAADGIYAGEVTVMGGVSASGFITRTAPERAMLPCLLLSVSLGGIVHTWRSVGRQHSTTECVRLACWLAGILAPRCVGLDVPKW
jgi:hypothetical protein